MAMPRGRQPGLGKVPGSGREKGTPNSHAITEKVKGDLLAVYAKLGGRRFLLQYGKDHPDEFVRHLMKLVPAAREPEPDISVAIGVQVENMNLQETAARVAFLLARAAHESGIDQPPPTRTLTIEPEPVAPVDTVPTLPPSFEPEPVNNPPVGLVYPGTAFEQGRERPNRRSRTKRDLL